MSQAAITNVGARQLDDLVDVNIPSPVSGEVITFNGTEWLSSGISSGGDSILVTASNYTITNSDGYTHIYVDTTAAPRTIILPAVASNDTRSIRIEKVDGSFAVTVTRAGSDTIGATATSRTLVSTGDFIDVLGKASDTLWIQTDYFVGWTPFNPNLSSQPYDAPYTGGGSINTITLLFAKYAIRGYTVSYVWDATFVITLPKAGVSHFNYELPIDLAVAARTGSLALGTITDLATQATRVAIHAALNNRAYAYGTWTITTHISAYGFYSMD